MVGTFCATCTVTGYPCLHYISLSTDPILAVEVDEVITPESFCHLITASLRLLLGMREVTLIVEAQT